MDIINNDGRIVGRINLTPDDARVMASAAAHTLDARTRALIDDTRARLAAHAPTPAADRDGDDTDTPARRRRRRWLWWLIGVVGVCWVLGTLTDDDDADDWTPPPVTVSPQEHDAYRATVTPAGDVIVGRDTVDNMFRPDSPLRAQFAHVIGSYGATGTTGSLLDANLRDGVQFCRALAAGDPAAQHTANYVTGVTDDGRGIGTQRRAVVVASLATMCAAQ